MEKYVEIEDKRAVPCMIDRCTQKLTLAEISALASPGLWVRFYEASTDPTNYSVRSTIDLYNGVLTNERSEDPLGFGMIHHEGICPFCIQPIHREEGCVYMMHEKPNRPGITPSDRPYCLAEYVVKELRDRYYHKARELFLAAGRGVSEKTDELSFCIECGRPCWRHTHFSADGNTFIEPVRKVNGGYDPGKCPGGGVQEKVARILAIREVYSSGKYRDKTQERRVAALAADRAPLQPELMQRAAAVLASKQWNMPLTHHTYESAAHRNMIEEVKNNNMGMMQSASASAENVRVQFNEEDEKEEMVDAARRRGGKHRKTRSQRKGRSRHTRRSKRKTRQAHTKNRRSN